MRCDRCGQRMFVEHDDFGTDAVCMAGHRVSLDAREPLPLIQGPGSHGARLPEGISEQRMRRHYNRRGHDAETCERCSGYDPSG